MAASKPPDEQRTASADTSGGTADTAAATAQSANTPAGSRSSSIIPSPQPSRTVSPVRRQPRPQNPSDAKIDAALQQSATTGDGQRNGSRAPSQPGAATEAAGAGMHWPVSPRLKSPPPSSTRRPSALASKPAANGTVNGAGSETPSPTKPVSTTHDVTAQQTNGESARGSGTTVVATKTSRGPSSLSATLATVEESENSSSQGPSESSAGAKPKSTSPKGTIKKLEKGVEESNDDPKPVETTKVSAKDDSSKTPRPKRSFPTLSSSKVRPSTDSVSKGMTVETETVSSIPQTATNGNMSERGATIRGEVSGLLRSRPSSETIKTKKDKKRANRKTPSIMSSTASTKADLFEASVASAVDEADSEDSEETFVYESNPPETRHRTGRHHSRTPSATSMNSLIDRKGGRTLADASRNVTGKKSMKFANHTYSHGTGEDDGDGAAGTVRKSTHRSHAFYDTHNHIGLFGRGGRQSMPGEESPYSHASRVRSTHESTPRQHSRPQTPRSVNGTYLRTPTNKGVDVSQYDYDGDGNTDDERTPLVGTVRTNRFRADRRRDPGFPTARTTHYYASPQRGWASRAAGCVVAVIVTALMILGVLGILFTTTKPLYDVSVQEIQNVLASEQELMLDLIVKATNPNLVAVTISDMDVNIFAKSVHVGTSSDHTHPPRDSPRTAVHNRRQQRRDSVDDGTDPIDDVPEDGEKQTMLLGRIFAFDSALAFEPSPINQRAQLSKGELRLARPGNATEAGGSARWEHVLQYEFDLIVRGIFKYQLPLSSRTMTTPISAKVVVKPEPGNAPVRKNDTYIVH